MPRLIAYYLPQYHPIPENDAWWGTGFTEWTNVAKAKPLFNGHYQPHFPADLGYYDLRVPEVREQQEAMARQYGIEGFMYYHYWFGNGRVLLERPMQQMLRAKKNNFPFCLCWANESWKGVWHGVSTGKTLIEQTYPGKSDYEKHFYYLLDAFNDERYIKVDNKPVFNVYMPLNLPDIHEFANTFHELAIKEGFSGMYLIGSRCPIDWNPCQYGFSGVIGSEMANLRIKQRSYFSKKKIYLVKKIQSHTQQLAKKKMFAPNKIPLVTAYENIIDQLITDKTFSFDYYPCAVPNWDNTPRAGADGLVFHHSTPQLFGKHLQHALQKVSHLPAERQFVFIKSWNEWAEGNYLEPDQQFGYGYLEEIKQQLQAIA
ncbi:lipopolysaccharide biosynthesis protein [Panacibacter ginsenosidivorans]|uniref:Lipopolysaccharide biosynthesis protein n=1 Tax=Panacibacter ginsenosidivorans TaxID=1813871 RepID=A0A5B8VC24_9BACT|nr:glycoside hydrolase family 99-like domain-containing protein [Panacibacter ginsenosidivorans]QEC69077.1 lipopolysaccharide biosynthesis protein [Panacibacter ginsenosidivorans]